jgi:mevalonate kinase
MSRTYPAKILLFGEYSVLEGSRALAIPFDRFTGSWSFEGKDRFSHGLLVEFCHFLIKVQNRLLNSTFDANKMRKDLERGLFFDSTIPLGVGLGSSGAVCAAVYDRFFTTKEDRQDLVKSDLAIMESFFHGVSSGVDPLLCLNQQALSLGPDTFQFIKQEKSFFIPFSKQGIDFYLFNSKKQRETAMLMDRYNQKKQIASFSSKLISDYIPVVDRSIENFLTGNGPGLLSQVKELCSLQWELFSEFFIADLAQNSCLQNLANRGVWVKLLGAGGGGMYLIINEKGQDLSVLFPKESLIRITGT